MDDSPPVSTISGLLDGLMRIEEKLARIERRLDSLEQLPNIVAVATDTLDQHAQQLQTRGIDLEERAGSALTLLERITDPKTTQLLTNMLALAEQAPNAVAMLVDSIDQRVGELDERIDLSERISTLTRIAERATSPSALGVLETLLDHLPALDHLLGAGLLSTGPLEVVSRAGQALSQAQQAAPHPVGPFGLFRALSDHEVQRSLGFAISFAREFGRRLPPDQTLKALPKSS